MRDVVKLIHHSDGKRYVEIVRSDLDGTFSFEEFVLDEEENAFCPSAAHGHSFSRFASLEDVLTEAQMHIRWLSSVSPKAPADATVYQLNWKILPGLKGLSCSEFRATRTDAPDMDQGVAFDCASDDERDAFLGELEAHFGPQRFSNNASAFESVRAYVLERMSQKR
jgi:hypothetical protein